MDACICMDAVHDHRYINGVVACFIFGMNAVNNSVHVYVFVYLYWLGNETWYENFAPILKLMISSNLRKTSKNNKLGNK